MSLWFLRDTRPHHLAASAERGPLRWSVQGNQEAQGGGSGALSCCTMCRAKERSLFSRPAPGTFPLHLSQRKGRSPANNEAKPMLNLVFCRLCNTHLQVCHSCPAQSSLCEAWHQKGRAQRYEPHQLARGSCPEGIRPWQNGWR